jgi:hypothetical protein
MVVFLSLTVFFLVQNFRYATFDPEASYFSAVVM